MTKEAYFSMCEQLGSQPVDSEVPVDIEDFPDEVMEAWIVFSNLSDKIDLFNNKYLGKDLTNIVEMFQLFGVKDKITCLKILLMFDSIERDQINNRKKK